MRQSAWIGVRDVIDAPTAVVWPILTQWEGYGQWNPYIVDVRSEARPGRSLNVTIAAPDGRIERVRANLVECLAERRLRWKQVGRHLTLLQREYLLEISAEPNGTKLRHGIVLSRLARRSDWIRTIRQVRLGLKLMTETLRRVAEAGSVAAWSNPAYPRTTSDYHWMPVHQARVYHQVLKAIEIIRRSPRRIEMMSLLGWSRGCRQGRSYLSCDGAISVGFHPEKLPATLHGLHPIIVGVLHARTFILDGAHRIAAYIQAGRTTIPAVRLTAAETAACIRDGFETKVRFDSANLLPVDNTAPTRSLSRSLVT